MPSKPYYFRESYGIGTNLQLYSLRQAWRCWQELLAKKEILNESRVRERCVVIVDLLGLSLSQLLGQNAPYTSENVPPPRKLLPAFLKITKLPDSRKRDVVRRFNRFMDLYDDCRHFGASKHKRIDALDFPTTEGFMKLGIEIWDLVMAHFRAGNEDQIEFESVKEILDKQDEDEIEI